MDEGCPRTNYATSKRRVTSGSVWLLVVCCLAAPILVRAADHLSPTTRDAVKRATVMVFTASSDRSRGDRPLSSGSGFFVNDSGLLVTNNHVVDPTHLQGDRKKVEFHYRTGRLIWSVVTGAGTKNEKTFDATVVYQNEAADQAILQTHDENGHKLVSPHYLRLLPESRLVKRMKVWALGFPGGDRQRRVKDKHPEVSIASGNILALPRTPAGRIRMIYTDVLARPGNSGGPMVDGDGFLAGTVTLMQKPKDREDTGGAKYSALVPAKLTGDMIRNAFELGKIPKGTDVLPFMKLLTHADGRFSIPEFPRRAAHDVLFFEDGDRIFGTITTDSLLWPSQRGGVEIPVEAAAYVLNNKTGAHLILEGGDRIAASNAQSTFTFRPIGGAPAEHKFSSVRAIGFKTSGRRLGLVAGKTIVIDSPDCHLTLSEVEGATQFAGKIGMVDIRLGDILRMTRHERRMHVITFRDGRRMTGKFTGGGYQALIAATRTPIRFDLSDVSQMHVEVVYRLPGAVGGLGLSGLLAPAGRDIRNIAEMLETGDVASARRRIDLLREPARFRRHPEAKQDQIRLLHAVTLLREGASQEAVKALRQSLRTPDENILAYALACGEVLSRHPRFEYHGQPLSDWAVFIDAGAAIADELLQNVRVLIDDARSLEGKTRGEYVSNISAVRKHEDSMRVAAVFRGEVADDELIRLWKHATTVCTRELARLGARIDEEEAADRRGNRRRGSIDRRTLRNVELTMQRIITELRKQRDDVLNTLRAYQTKLWEYGFRIEDPDIRGFEDLPQPEPDSGEGGSGG